MEADLDGQDTRAGLLENAHVTLLRGHDTQLCEKKPRADHGVTGEFQLFLRREDAQTRQGTVLRRFLDKHGFREIHLASDGKHLAFRKAVAVCDHG